MKVEKINDLYLLMQKAADDGMGSFFLEEKGYKLLFANRISEVGNDLPTLLVKSKREISFDNSFEILARTGP